MNTKTLSLPNQAISSFPDLVGRKIRNVTVLEQVVRPDRFTRWWLCVCHCGARVTVSSAQLGRNSYRLCQCQLKSEQLKKSTIRTVADKQCPICDKQFSTVINKSGRRRTYCSAKCKQTYWRLEKGSPAAPHIATPSGEARTCSSCQVPLPLSDYHQSYKILASGEKRYYYGSKCRLCEYETAKPAKRKYYLKNKHLIKNTSTIRKWRQKNAKLGKCLNCGKKPEKPARLCVYCHIEHWIGSTVYNIKKNAHKTLPMEVLEHRATILRGHKPVLLKLPGAQGYPQNRLGHKVAVRTNPNEALLATNLEWVKHKARGRKYI